MTTAAGATTTTFTSAGARATTATGKVLYATGEATESHHFCLRVGTNSGMEHWTGLLN